MEDIIIFFILLNQFTHGKKVLDYGCGSGQFLIEAKSHGYECAGTEFNPSLVKELNDKLAGIRFFTISDFFNNHQKYDIIYLSNVLEHLINPKEIMERLKNHLNPEGLFVLEGPLENNFNLALQVRKLFFSYRKRIGKSKANHPPFHIFLANATNQSEFFHKVGLHQLYFGLQESPWPFPASFKEAMGVKQKLMCLIGNLSVVISRFNSRWGNSFVYVGKTEVK